MTRRVVLAVAMVAMLVLAGTAFAEGGQEKGGGKPVTLTFWTSSENLSKWYTGTAIPAFEKAHPNAKIELAFLPIAEYKKKIAVAIPSNTAADLLEIEDSWAVRYIAEGFFDENAPAIRTLVDTKMHPDVKKLVTFNGKQIGVPIDQFHELLFYNERMFAEAGLTRAPDTIDELISYAAKLTVRDANGQITRSGFSMRLGGNPSGTTQKFWAIGLLPNGVDIIEESKKAKGKFHAGFDNEGGYAALKFYIDMLYKHKVDDFSSMKDSDALANEKTAILMREPWVGDQMDTKAPTVKYNTAPLPKAKQRSTFMVSLLHYLPKATKAEKKPLAWDFVSLVLSDEMQLSMLKIAKDRSPLKEFDYSRTLSKSMLNGFAIPSDMKIYGVGMHVGYDAATSKIGDMLPSVFKKAELLDNPAAIKAEVKKLADIVNAAYKESGEYAD